MPTRIGFLLIDGFALMSYAPVMEPFRAANRLSGADLYSWCHYSVGGRPARASNGIALSVDGPVEAISGLDMLFVCAGGNPALFDEPHVFSHLRRASRFGARLVGVSGGPFILGRAGLLDGYRCTIHWEHEAAFRETFTAPRLERGLFVMDRDRLSCAGGLAGLDLSITLIKQEYGAKLARAVSDWYIQSELRQGGSAQLVDPGQRYRIASARLARALALMEDYLPEPLDRMTLAKTAGVSVRQLERLFSAQLGRTIAAHYLAIRLERARRLLTETNLTVTEVAAGCGFASASHFSREYKRHFSTPPSAGRRVSVADNIRPQVAPG